MLYQDPRLAEAIDGRHHTVFSSVFVESHPVTFDPIFTQERRGHILYLSELRYRQGRYL